MKTFSDTDALAAVATFDRDFFDPEQRFKAIGTGALGGKGAGLALAQAVLGAKFDPKPFGRVEVSIPSLTVLRSDVFEEFVRKNHLDELLDSGDDDEAIARAVQRADLPVKIVGDLRALVEQVHTPLAIRSSSLLEDALGQPFAGVYQTKMIPNNQPSADDRFRRLTEAVKFVYASVYFRDARAYLAATGRKDRRDSMAIVIQEVVGTRFGDRFYPHVSGVARSYNYYPAGHATPAEGVVSLALGLGKTIVDGGVCWTYSPAWPAAPAPFASPAELASGTQTKFWAVNMGKPPEFDPIRETEYLLHGSLEEAEHDDTIARIASTFDRHSGRVRMGIGTDGPRVLDFAMLLQLREPPLNDLLREMLHLFEDELQTPVEMEFAMTFDPHRFGFLQVRPMTVPAERVVVEEQELASPDAVVSSSRVLGNGIVEGIRDVVYVRPDTAGRLDSVAMAAEIERANIGLAAEKRAYLLIGFGRWGSSDPSLGIPVVWTQISGARVLVEAMSAGMNVEPSQGSHFFHNLSSFRVPYFSVPITRPKAVDWEWLEQQPAVSESAGIRHVRLSAPLVVKVDGRSGRGVVLKR